MNNSVGKEKAFGKISTSMYNKKEKLNKVGVEGTYLKVIQTTYSPTVNIRINSEELKLSSLRSGTRQECPLSFIQYNLGSPSQNN